MFRYALVLLSLVCFLCSAAGQEATPTAAPVSRLHVKSPYLAAYKSGADVDVKAFLFRYVAPGFKPMIGPSHPRFVHALVVTNVESATCETAFFHWDKKHGAVPDLPVTDESKFLLVFYGHFPDEPEYIYMGEDNFYLSITGSVDRSKGGEAAESRRGSEGEQAALNFFKLGRKERFALLRTMMADIWPFRPYGVRMSARTTRGDDVDPSTQIPSVRPPNFVTVEGEADKLKVKGEVPVITCK